MNVTKNKLIEALNYLGEFPKISLKKDELIEKLNQFYDKNIIHLPRQCLRDAVKALVLKDFLMIDE